MAPLAGRIIEINELEDDDDFHAGSVRLPLSHVICILCHLCTVQPCLAKAMHTRPGTCRRPFRLRLLRVTTDFEETMQPTWLIDKPLLIEGCLEKPSSVFLHDPDTIQEGEATLAFTVPAKTLNRVYSVEE